MKNKAIQQRPAKGQPSYPHLRNQFAPYTRWRRVEGHASAPSRSLSLSWTALAQIIIVLRFNPIILIFLLFLLFARDLCTHSPTNESTLASLLPINEGFFCNELSSSSSFAPHRCRSIVFLSSEYFRSADGSQRQRRREYTY